MKVLCSPGSMANSMQCSRERHGASAHPAPPVPKRQLRLEAENLMLAESLSAEFAAAIPTERLRQRVDAAVAGLQVASMAPVKRSWWSG
jgi:hypothetical protein